MACCLAMIGMERKGLCYLPAMVQYTRQARQQLIQPRGPLRQVSQWQLAA